VVHIFSGYYLAIKNNEIMSLAGKWMELKIIMLSEISQAQTKSHVSLMRNSDLNNNNMITEEGLSGGNL
jgi:hypothetical protein